MPDKRMKTLLNILVQQGIKDQRVLQAISAVPREYFVEEAFAHKAYENTALPIGLGQTISQPYVVARMTELLCLEPTFNVLEIGTGSGYQTAVLANLVKHVFSVERIKSLQWQAKRRLKRLDLHNVSTHHGDGSLGWPVRGPFNAILVTAAAPEVPVALLNQLMDGGYLVLPVGEQTQSLQCIQRQKDDWVTTLVEPARFVPLIQGTLA